MKIEDIDLLDVADFEGEDRYQWPRPAKVIFEANYKNPSFSGEVMERLKEGDAQYVSGNKWLLYQALTGYVKFTGEIPDLEAMEQVM